MNQHIRWFADLDSDDVPLVGGKNASLGEMIAALHKEGIRVPDGFATTAQAYRHLLKVNNLESQIRDQIQAWQADDRSLAETGQTIRQLFRQAEIPPDVAKAIRDAYAELSGRYQTTEVDVAARSSATAEDLPEASFAGQQETYLNIRGSEALLDACRHCYASLFTDRAISYREEQGFDHLDVALSVGVQKMVRADKASAGVMFTLDTETGFPGVVVINAAWGLGENVVQGTITPDEYRVFKPLLDQENLMPIIDKQPGDKEKKMVYTRQGNGSTRNVATSPQEQEAFVLTDAEILQLARWAVAIEDHYGRPMDIEWAKDGNSEALFIVQARPETVQSQKDTAVLKTYTLEEAGDPLLNGLAIGQAVAVGEARVLHSPDERERFSRGSILVTGMTDPDWVPIMKQARGIITEHGGRTSHAAIVSRELGIPAIVGAENATDVLGDGDIITLSCAEGEQGRVYAGERPFTEEAINLDDIPQTNTQIMMNIASPDAAFRWWRLPVQGIGLARMEFIINNIIKVHPLALVDFAELEDEELCRQIEELTPGYDDKTAYFVDNLALGIAKIAAAQHPHDVVVRLSDFKTNEYADLIGGHLYEPAEENPMLGWRGASRYYSEGYRNGFALECRAIQKVRREIGLDNVIVMLPFCRTLDEADRVLEVMADNGLKRGEAGLQVYVMAEIPANIILAREFAQRFDGFSIGSNDLTQLILGVDRDSDRLADLFDERDEAVKRAIGDLISRAHAGGVPVGICGQAPSDYPDFAAFLVREGIDSISINPDSIVTVKERVAEVEKAQF